MKHLSIAKRYANSLFQLSKENNTITDVVTQIHLLQETFEKDLKIIDLFTSPKLSLSEKKTVFLSLSKNIDVTLQNTLLLMIEKKYIQYWKDFFNYFIDLVNQKEGIKTSTVFSAVALGEKEIQQISDVFSKKIGTKKLIIQNVVDPSVLGGLRVRIGNLVYDGTIQHHLETMSRRLKG